MRRSHLFLPALGALALAGCSADRPEPMAPFNAPGSVSRSVSESPTAGRYILASNGGFSKDFAAKIVALGGTVETVHAGAGVAVVSGISDAAAAQLSAIGGVSDVEADMEIALDAPIATAEADASAVGDPSVSSVTNPKLATRYNFQWNMRDIGADKAWAAGKLGSSSVTVAIIDTGLDYDINDLNGLVDLSRSHSFVTTDNAITSTYFPTRNPINDYNGHGTNVATQVSSKAFALAGVTSKTTLIGVKVLNQAGRGSLADVLNGVLWAADHGADVANMSLGGGFAKAGNGRYVGLINKTFNYAKQQGMLIVVAAGNDGADLDHNGNTLVTYCGVPNVVCVSSVGPAVAGDIGTSAVDAPSYYTNFGRSDVSVAGPGGNADAANGFTVSAWPWGFDIASWVWSYCPKYRIAGFTAAGAPVLTACAAGNRLSGFIGTSQATPHVAGLAALIAAEKGIKGQPSALRAAIEKSADDLGQPGTDPFYGRGRINVAKALGL